MEKKGSSRKSKWMSAILILAGICLLLYAWSIGQGETKRMDAKEEVLSFAIYGDADTEKIAKKAVQSFQELHHCKVEVYCYGTEKEEENQVLGQAAGGKSFDVFYITPAVLKIMKDAGEVVSLESVLTERKEQGDMFYPVTLQEGQIEQQQYALPIGVQPYMLYYNRDLLERMGLEDPQAMFQEKRWTEEVAKHYFQEFAEKSGKYTFDMEKKLSASEYDMRKNSFQSGEEAFILGDLSMTRLLYNADFSWDIIPAPSEHSDFSNSTFTIPMIAAGTGTHQDLACEFVDYYVSTLGQKLRLESGECLLPSLSMVFYTSMGDVAFPEHSNYYFFAIENGYASEQNPMIQE